jgi:hypothetical protein
MDDIKQYTGFAEHKYYIRYFVYEDFTRQRAYQKLAFWADDKMIGDLQFGNTFEMQAFHPSEQPVERLTVANKPVLKSIPHPDKEGLTADVFFAPNEQWMLYKDASEEEINREPDIVDNTL